MSFEEPGNLPDRIRRAEGSPQEKQEKNSGFPPGIAAAIAAPLLASALQWVLWGILQPFAWFLYFPAVWLSALLGGTAGGLAATLLSGALSFYLFIPPYLSWIKESAHPLGSWVFFMLLGIAFSLSRPQWKAPGSVLPRSALPRRLADRLLLQNEKLFRFVFEKASIGIAVLDMRTGQFRRVNGRFCQILGLPEEKLVERTYPSVTFSEDLGEDAEKLELLRHNRIPNFRKEKRFLRQDGSTVWTTVFCVPLWESEDPPQYYLAMVDDISERKKLEKALKISEAKHRMVADYAYDWEFWVAPNGQFVYSSPSCRRMTGYDPSDFLSRPELLDLLIHPEDRIRFQIHRQLVHERTLPEEIEFRLLRRDGKMRWIHHVCTPVFDQDGQYQGVRGSNRDITDRKLAQEAMRGSVETYRKLFSESSAAGAVFEILCDSSGQAADFLALEVNSAFETMVRRESGEASGEKASERLSPEELQQWLRIFGPVARTGRPADFEIFSPYYRKKLTGAAFRPEAGKVAITFSSPMPQGEVEAAESIPARPVEPDHGKAKPPDFREALEASTEEFSLRSGIRTEVRWPARFRATISEPLGALFLDIARAGLDGIFLPAGARSVRLEIRHKARGEQRIVLELHGDGRKIPTKSKAARKPGVAGHTPELASLEERIRQAGGDFKLSSGLQGTVLRASLPVSDGR